MHSCMLTRAEIHVVAWMCRSEIAALLPVLEGERGGRFG
jgi:hypothetical protein